MLRSPGLEYPAAAIKNTLHGIERTMFGRAHMRA
jgi:hypothetical protein